MSLVPLALLFLAAFTVQNALGFGATVVILSVGAQLAPLDQVLPLVVPVSCIASAVLVWRDREHLAWGFLLRRVLPCMGPGLLLGVLLFQRLELGTLEHLYGALVVVLALSGLRGGAQPAAAQPEARGTPAWVTAAGVVHGMFASGGPLLVYAVQRLGLDKRAFRGTLSLVWLVLNATLSLVYAVSGRLGPHELTQVAGLLPALALSVFAGEWVHTRLDARRLRLGVNSLLLVAGGLLVL